MAFNGMRIPKMPLGQSVAVAEHLILPGKPIKGKHELRTSVDIYEFGKKKRRV